METETESNQNDINGSNSPCSPINEEDTAEKVIDDDDEQLSALNNDNEQDDDGEIVDSDGEEHRADDTIDNIVDDQVEIDHRLQKVDDNEVEMSMMITSAPVNAFERRLNTLEKLKSMKFGAGKNPFSMRVVDDHSPPSTVITERKRKVNELEDSIDQQHRPMFYDRRSPSPNRKRYSRDRHRNRRRSTSPQSMAPPPPPVYDIEQRIMNLSHTGDPSPNYEAVLGFAIEEVMHMPQSDLKRLVYSIKAVEREHSRHVNANVDRLNELREIYLQETNEVSLLKTQEEQERRKRNGAVVHSTLINRPLAPSTSAPFVANLSSAPPPIMFTAPPPVAIRSSTSPFAQFLPGPSSQPVVTPTPPPTMAPRPSAAAVVSLSHLATIRSTISNMIIAGQQRSSQQASVFTVPPPSTSIAPSTFTTAASTVMAPFAYTTPPPKSTSVLLTATTTPNGLAFSRTPGVLCGPSNAATSNSGVVVQQQQQQQQRYDFDLLRRQSQQHPASIQSTSMQQHYAMPQQQSLPDRSSSIQTRWNQPVGAGIASFKRQRFERVRKDRRSPANREISEIVAIIPDEHDRETSSDIVVVIPDDDDGLDSLEAETRKQDDAHST